MLDDVQAQIEQLRDQIYGAERQVAALEQECDAIQAELADFEARYNTLIKPLSKQIEAVREAIGTLRELQLRQQLSLRFKDDITWRKWQRPPTPDDVKPSARKSGDYDGKLKRLYRLLARRFHPDLAADADERSRRTKIMAMINRAYHEADLDSLEALNDAAPPDIRVDAATFDSTLSLAVMTLRQLTREYVDLSIKLRDLKVRHHDLKYGSLMSLKIEATLARARGEDLLQNLAQEMQAEYWSLMQQLDILRAEVETE